jgi:acetyl esterase/lipase
MPLALDPEFAVAFESFQPGIAARPTPKLHDVVTRRSNLAAIMKEALDPLPALNDVVQQNLTVKTFDEVSIDLLHVRRLSRDCSSPTAAIIHVHGGGMIAGSVEIFAKHIARLVHLSGVALFSVNYRKAPEYPDPTPTEDVYAALQFLHNNADKLDVDPARIAIMGESAGGGIAAGVALMARDRGMTPPIAKQILIYPMLDDMNLVPDPTLAPFAFWSYESNVTGWKALLGGRAGKSGADVSYYAAPARAGDLSGLPDTYIDVGGLDIFRDEDIAFVMNLIKAGVPVEFHLYPGVPHAFDWLAPQIKISQMAFANRARTMQNI